MGDANVFNVDDLQGYVFDDLELSGIWRSKIFLHGYFQKKREPKHSREMET